MDDLKCPECLSANILTKRDGTRWCRRCGHEWKVKREK